MLTQLDDLLDPADEDVLTILGTGSRYHDNPALIGSWVRHVVARSSARTVVIRHGDCPSGPDAPGADQIFHEICTTHRGWFLRGGRLLVEDAMPADWDSHAADCPADRGCERVKHPEDIWHPGALNIYCVKAGPRRNAAMVTKTVAAAGEKTCLAFPHPRSLNGTANCARLAKKAGIHVEWIRYRQAVAA